MIYMNPSLKIYDEVVKEFIKVDFEVETLDRKNQFTEGPVWSPEGFYLYSDIPANVIYKIIPGHEKEIYISNSGTENPGDPELKPDQAGSNALAWYEDDLLVCQHGGHGIARYDGSSLTPFINNYNGKPFNSPNDFIIHTNGDIYFSDPPYGLKDGQLNPSRFQPLAGVYCWRKEHLDLICTKYQYPNGVCFSPDQRILYICSNKPFEKFISEYNPATNQFIRILAEENSDGIECDRKGNVYLCNKDGLIILDPSNGRRLALIQLPSIPANICWGGHYLNDLFITARENVYLIRDLQI